MSIEIEKSVFIDSLKGRMSPPIYDEAQALLAEGCARRHTHSPARARVPRRPRHAVGACGRGAHGPASRVGAR